MTLDAKLFATLGAVFLAYYSYSAWASRMAGRGEIRTFGNSFGGAIKQKTQATKDTKAPDTGGSAHEPTIADVLVVKAMLTKGLSLPVEIIDTIVDFAEYWPHTTAETSSVPLARGGSRRGKEDVFVLRLPPLGLHNWERVAGGTDDSPADTTPPKPQPPGEEFSAEDFQKLIASPIPMLAHPCRRIVFTIKSQDQGWGGELGTSNTFKGSWTWFEAGLERWCKTSPAHADPAVQETQQDQESQQPSLNLDGLCTVFPEVKPDERTKGYTFDHPLHPREHLKIQCNRTAGKEPEVHRVVWSYNDDVDPGRDVKAAQNLVEQGRGMATGNGKFVRDLKLGDVVTVWAKARFAAWVNHAHFVKMDVYYAI